MPRPLLPDDDLYARLELDLDATPEAVELAWRALLRRHHPDVAGDAGATERAKRINVAHEWLSDPILRARYDEERHGRVGLRVRGRSAAAGRGGSRQPSPGAPPRPRRAPPRPRVLDAAPAERVTRFLARVELLSPDELDRLALADPPPIAFVATLRRFLPEAADAELKRVEAELRGRVVRDRWADVGVREALRAVAAELVLGAALDDLLAEPFRGRARERLVRAWEASVDQPRHGPNGRAVAAVIDRAARLTPTEATAILRAATRLDAGDRPWPAGLDPTDDEGLRISAALADTDAVAATRTDGLSAAQATRLRRLVGRTAHVVALRHAFPAARYRDLVVPWAAALGPAAPGLDRSPVGRVRRSPG